MNKMALQATLHCLLGCSIGEVAGMMIGAHYGLDAVTTIVIAVTLAFLSGYALSLVPLVRGGIALGVAAKLVLAADTLSITTMEIVDNLVMYLVPGAMDASLLSRCFGERWRWHCLLHFGRPIQSINTCLSAAKAMP